MRPIAIILLVICLGLMGLTGYLYFTANVVITDIDCVAVDAADQEAFFDQLKSQVEEGVFTGTPFATGEIGKAADYQFYTYTVRLTNQTFLRLEVAEIQVTPMNGDVLQLAADGPKNVNARSRGSVDATILTGKDNHNVRELVLTYYLWGLPFTERVTYSK